MIGVRTTRQPPRVDRDCEAIFDFIARTHATSLVGRNELEGMHGTGRFD